ncbi:FAD-dependent oxidoreductase [Carnobacterium funditum]|uniref:FAD-dependent oxidoreductase n=1 Tax=Carnobacterium funditum TaxID=2752 RepID=UPI00054D1CED|nr:FAD-dependent oxidoreductase [Carnobacterium funditum]
MNIVIVGGSFAGITAVLTAREKYKEATITLIEKEETIGFIPGALYSLLNGEIESLAEAHFTTVEAVKRLNIQVILNAKVENIDTDSQRLTYKKLNRLTVISYDKLILATGSVQNSYQIKGMESNKIIRYKTVEKTRMALELVENNQVFTIVGGGQIGIEMADCLINQKKKVQLIESMNGIVMKYFDQEMVEPLLKEMQDQGVVFYFDETVKEIKEVEEHLILKTQNHAIKSDCAVFALSVKPNVPYLDSKIRCHEDGAIFVDEYLQTSVENVFAIGDAIQMPSSLSDETFYISLINNAVRTGVVVIDNLMKPQTPFIGTARTIGTKVFGYYIASTGMTETESIFFDEEIAVSHVSQPASLFNGKQTINGKLIYNTASGKVLGAQLISKVNILEKINTLSLGIQMGITLNELAQKDYFFHPSWSTVYDITNQLGLMKD